VLSIEDIEPLIAFIRLSNILRIYKFNNMNTPKIAAKDIGNGNKIEIVRLIPKDIPSQPNLVKWELLVIFDTHS
jgi:hypothetical protein